ncbi:MAG: class I SAM-dependent methyltransferase [Bacteroidetes bacterium]|nr:class I SAM-dependent methyltransferase [Bacteroidota bacterium]
MENEQLFKKVQSFNEVLLEYFHFPGLKVIDVGCGTGDLVRWMASQGAAVTGIDLSELIDKAEQFKRVGTEKYKVGIAQELVFKKNSADLIIYLASFHHIPQNMMLKALKSCHQILKPDGHAVFIEPVAEVNSYYDLTRLVEDEADIQRIAYEYLRSSKENMFEQIIESFFYTERSFQDYIKLINVYVPDENQRERIIQQAKNIVLQKKETIETCRFRSNVRVNIFQKKI